MKSLRIVDSHTAGEPTRVVVEGGPDLGGGTLADRRERFRAEDDRYRSAIIARLTDFALRVRRSLAEQGIRGANGAEIDHVEVYAPLGPAVKGSRNFVLCPGEAYDRSPCGTGTSAKLACLYASGELRPGEIWRQESVIGTVFEASFTRDESDSGRILPHITGRAYATA